MFKYIVLIISLLFFGCTTSNKKISKHENHYNNIFCSNIGGDREVRHYYNNHNYILVDCETSDYVYEGGKDKESSLDSIQQAVFFSILTKKKPAVVIFNTDRKLGKYEYRIREVAKKLNIKFILIEASQM